MDDQIRIMQRRFHNGVQIHKTLAQLIQLCNSFFFPRGRVDTDGVPNITETHTEQTRLHDTAINEGALCLGNNDVLVRAVLQHIGCREITGINQEDLSIFQMRCNSFNQLFMEFGLNVDDNNLCALDVRHIAAHLMDVCRFNLTKLIQGHFAFIFLKECKIVIMHGV